MNINQDLTDSITVDEQTTKRRRAGSLVAILLGVVTLSLASLTAVASPASAATSGWRYFQTDYDYCADAAIWHDGYGRMTRTGYFDFNNDCQWDTLGRDIQGDGVVDELWIDLYPGGDWDYLVIGHTVWQGQNQSGRYGESWPGPHGTYWARQYDVATTVGGSPTSPSAFYSVMLNLARATGVVDF